MVSVVSIVWATFARNLPVAWEWMGFAWHTRMISVIGTMTLLVTGVGLSTGAILTRGRKQG